MGDGGPTPEGENEFIRVYVCGKCAKCEAELQQQQQKYCKTYIEKCD